jgi:hypothetical protein
MMDRMSEEQFAVASILLPSPPPPIDMSMSSSSPLPAYATLHSSSAAFVPVDFETNDSLPSLELPVLHSLTGVDVDAPIGSSNEAGSTNKWKLSGIESFDRHNYSDDPTSLVPFHLTRGYVTSESSSDDHSIADPAPLTELNAQQLAAELRLLDAAPCTSSDIVKFDERTDSIASASSALRDSDVVRVASSVRLANKSSGRKRVVARKPKHRDPFEVSQSIVKAEQDEANEFGSPSIDKFARVATQSIAADADHSTDERVTGDTFIKRIATFDTDELHRIKSYGHDRSNVDCLQSLVNVLERSPSIGSNCDLTSTDSHLLDSTSGCTFVAPIDAPPVPTRPSHRNGSTSARSLARNKSIESLLMRSQASETNGLDKIGLDMIDKTTVKEIVCLDGEKRIPRPPNAFMIFGQQNRKLLANQYPQYTNKQISKILGDEWRKMKPDDKSYFHRLADDAYSKHMKKYPGKWRVTFGSTRFEL